MNNLKILEFPNKTKKRKKTISTHQQVKYFNEEQIKLLRRTVRDASQLAIQKGQVTAIREWMLIDLLTSSGIREAEAVDLRCGDIKSGYGESSIYIRNGKGFKSRLVQIPNSLKKHFKTFLSWKIKQGESVDNDSYIFVGQRGPWKTSAVQQCVKKWLKKLNLYEPGKSAHSLRHSYAVQIYRKERDIRTVQTQLGHSNIATTQIYASVLPEDIQDQIKNLWN